MSQAQQVAKSGHGAHLTTGAPIIPRIAHRSHLTAPPKVNPSSGKSSAQISATRATMSALRSMPLWIGVAIASGACAAFNGVFAKL